MKTCNICGLSKSPLRLRLVWDKEIQAYMDHYVCNDCQVRDGALELAIRTVDSVWNSGATYEDHVRALAAALRAKYK